MAPLRLLMIADDREGGLPLAQAESLASGLDPAQFAARLVRLTTRPHSESSVPTHAQAANGLASIPVAERWRFDPRALASIVRLLGREQPEVIHTFGPLAGSLARSAALLHRDDRIVASLASDVFDRWTFPERWWQRYLANRTRLNIVSTPAERALAIDAGWPARHVHVAPLAIEPLPRAALSAGEIVQTVDGEVSLPADVELIVVAAPLEPRRRIKEAIWAFDLLRSVRPQSRLLVVGRGPQRRDLELFRDQQDCHDLIHFVADEHGAAWLAHAAVLWSFDASLRPSFPTLRAIASGVPTVASDTLGHRPYVLSGQSGFLVPAGARAAIAQATLRLLEDDPLRAAQASAAAAHMAEGYSAAALLREQTSLYRTAL
jgi:glycosyltransferase involved in cell wall biosynthesis